MKTQLYPFQEEGVRLLHSAFDGRALLADEVGLGKTVQSLAYAHRHLPTDPPGPIVVVVPSYLKINWARQAAQHLGLRVEVLGGQRRPPDKPPPRNPNQIFVVNYEVLVPPHWAARTPPAADSWVAYLASLCPRLLIGDEAQYLRDQYSARTRAFRWLARRVSRVVLLTATPLANKPPSLFPLLHILRPDVWPSEFDFCLRYTHARKSWFGWVFEGARNMDELNARMAEHVLIRRRQADVLGDLPPVTLSVVPMEVDAAEYRRAEEDFLGWLEEKRPGLAAGAAAAIELAKMNQLKKLAGELKVRSVLRWAEDLLEETGGKLLLGAFHYDVTGPLVRGFGRRRAALVDGRMSPEEKQIRFDRFNADPSCEVLVANYQAGGTGWSCRSTSDAALCEFPWTPGEVSQFVGRIHGIDRGVPGAAARVRLLAAAGTIDEDLCDALERKQAWAAEAVDGDPGAGAFDIQQQVRELLRKRVEGRR